MLSYCGDINQDWFIFNIVALEGYKSRLNYYRHYHTADINLDWFIIDIASLQGDKHRLIYYRQRHTPCNVFWSMAVEGRKVRREEGWGGMKYW